MDFICRRVIAFIGRHGLVPSGATVVVGVSGGADSVCLLHILAKWRKESGIKLHVAHLNHQLRGAESEADAEYVSDLARSLGVPVTIDRQDVAAYRRARNLSIEEAARELRHAFLARVAGEVGAGRIALGHTRDDQVETILMHILRGTGTGGLCGLAPASPMPLPGGPGEQPPVPLSLRVLPIASGQSGRGNLLVIRPLLDITREETTAYCREHRLDPRIDSSNLSLSFFRNRLRVQLLPLLRQYNPAVDRALLRLADIAGEDSAFIEGQAAGLWEEVARQEENAVRLDRKKTARLPAALQRQLLRTAVARLVGDTRDMEATHIEAARGLLGKPVGKRVSLPHGLICRGEYDELVITRGPSRPSLPGAPPPLSGEFPLKVPGETILPGWQVRASIVPARGDPTVKEGPDEIGAVSAEFDFHKTGGDLFVRQRRPGDRFQPLGMDMPKKLQEFMIDARIPRSWRGRIPIVCSPRQIVWVVGWRIDDRVKVTEATRDVLRLEFEVTKPGT